MDKGTVSQKTRYGLCLLTFIGALAVYLKTLAPTVTCEDSGELIAAAYLLGVPHQPGFPLWCLLAKIFTFLPFGDIAYRVNFMSAFWGSASALLLTLLVMKLTL